MSAPPLAAIPDYGGRDAPPGPSSPAAVPGADSSGPAGPLAQAWRAFEALAIVLAGIVGVLFLLKRFNLVQSDGQGRGRLRLPPQFNRLWTPAASSPEGPGPPLAVLSSQALPGGGMLHLVSVAGRTVLVGATAQSVSLIVDWETQPVPEVAETPAEAAAFAEYLSRADMADSGPGRAARTRLGAAGERLQSVLARSRETGSEEAAP